MAGQDRQPQEPEAAQMRSAGGVGREGCGALINVTLSWTSWCCLSAAGMRASPLPALLWAARPPPGSRAGPAPSPSGCSLPGPPCPPATSQRCPKRDPPARLARLPAVRPPRCWLRSLKAPCSAEEEPQHFQVIRCLPDASSPFPSLDVRGHPWGGLTRGVQGWDGCHSAAPWGSTGRDTH